jgi:hypothetical protein
MAKATQFRHETDCLSNSVAAHPAPVLVATSLLPTIRSQCSAIANSAPARDMQTIGQPVMWLRIRQSIHA